MELRSSLSEDRLSPARAAFTRCVQRDGRLINSERQTKRADIFRVYHYELQCCEPPHQLGLHVNFAETPKERQEPPLKDAALQHPGLTGAPQYRDRERCCGVRPVLVTRGDCQGQKREGEA